MIQSISSLLLRGSNFEITLFKPSSFRIKKITFTEFKEENYNHYELTKILKIINMNETIEIVTLSMISLNGTILQKIKDTKDTNMHIFSLKRDKSKGLYRRPLLLVETIPLKYLLKIDFVRSSTELLLNIHRYYGRQSSLKFSSKVHALSVLKSINFFPDFLT